MLAGLVGPPEKKRRTVCAIAGTPYNPDLWPMNQLSKGISMSSAVDHMASHRAYFIGGTSPSKYFFADGIEEGSHFKRRTIVATI